MHHTRTLDPQSPAHHWTYARWALDTEAAIAWPGAHCVAERVEPAGDRDGLVRIVRTYSTPVGS